MKKILCVLICIAIMTGTAFSALAYSMPDFFIDVPSDHWAYGDIYELKKLGVVSGSGNMEFNPEGNITKEEFLKMVISALGVTPAKADLNFIDVKKDSWYEEYVKTGVSHGIINGKNEKYFGTGEKITRQDACVILCRAMATTENGMGKCDFSDEGEISDYAKDAVKFLASHSVVSGYTDGGFHPKDLCTRAQSAKIIKSALDIEKKYFDGKRKIVFMGDSITNAAEYLIYINAFLKTRFPNEKVEVLFAGNDGDTVGLMLQRFDDDVVLRGATDAFILFGANDINRGLYPTGTKEQQEKAIDTSVANMDILLDKTKKAGVQRITLLLPPALDERDYKGASSKKMEGVCEGLKNLSQKYIELAKKHRIRYIDLLTPTLEILSAKKNSGEVEILKTDRIHPNRIGHFVLANEILQDMYGSYGLVASVTIDTKEKTYRCDNSDVADLKVNENSVSYTYKPKAVPMGIDTKNITEGVSGNGYTDAEEAYPEFVDFTQKMNREIIKVTDLPEGSYDVAFDNKVIGTFSAEELQKGINIATLPDNPGQIKGKAVIDSYMYNYWTQIKVRRCETRFTTLRKEGLYGADKATITGWVDATYPEGNVLRAYWTSFLGLYEDYDMYKRQWDYLERTAYKLAAPGVYAVNITPSK